METPRFMGRFFTWTINEHHHIAVSFPNQLTCDTKLSRGTGFSVKQWPYDPPLLPKSPCAIEGPGWSSNPSPWKVSTYQHTWQASIQTMDTGRSSMYCKGGPTMWGPSTPRNPSGSLIIRIMGLGFGIKSSVYLLFDNHVTSPTGYSLSPHGTHILHFFMVMWLTFLVELWLPNSLPMERANVGRV